MRCGLISPSHITITAGQEGRKVGRYEFDSPSLGGREHYLLIQTEVVGFMDDGLSDG